MQSKLRQLFDKCPWSRKVLGQLPPNQDEIIYAWTEDQAGFAESFFSDTAMAVYPEETPVVRRSLYLGAEGFGQPMRLCVREEEKAEYRQGLPDMAKAYTELIDPDKVEGYLKDKLGGD